MSDKTKAGRRDATIPVRVAVPDLISPSYFPAIAAVQLGLFDEEGIDAELLLRFPVTDAAQQLRDGEFEFLAGAAHAPLYAFPDWQGAKLLMALSQNTYWFLVVRADLPVAPGDLGALCDVRLGAAPGPDIALRAILDAAGVDMADNRIEIGPVPGSDGAGVSFGVTAAEALQMGKIDGFWANGMGAEVATRRGVGRVIVDARRGEGPEGSAGYTFPALSATEDLINNRPNVVDATIRAIVRAQHMLRDNPDAARVVGERLFPAMEASLIAELIERDSPFYTAEIARSTVADLNEFALRSGLATRPAQFHEVVAYRVAGLRAG